MAINKKVKKAAEAINKAADKLIKLVNKKSSKKKILKQVDKVQDLNKDKRKLHKKVEETVAKDKSKGSEKKKLALKKSPSKKTVVEGTKMDEKLHKRRSSIAKSKKIRPLTNQNSTKKPATEKTVEPADAHLSIDMNAKTAFSKISELSSLQQLEDFIKGEQRKTVLDKANARKNALTKSE